MKKYYPADSLKSPEILRRQDIYEAAFCKRD